MQSKTYWIAALTMGLFSAGAVAQNSANGSTPAAGQPSATANQNEQIATGDTATGLKPGTILLAELSKSLDAKKAKSGDPVEAKLTQDVKANGKVVLHRGSKLLGHVTEVQDRSKEIPESRLGIVFDKAVVKGGPEVPFSGMIQAIAPPVEGYGPSVAGDPASLSSASPMGGQPFGAGRSAGGPSASPAPAVNAQVGNDPARGTLTPANRGPVDFPGVRMRPAAAGIEHGWVISCADHNVKLDSGTQMVLEVSGSAVAR